MLEWVVMDVLRDIENTLEMCVCVCVCVRARAHACAFMCRLSHLQDYFYRITISGRNPDSFASQASACTQLVSCTLNNGLIC